MFAGDHVYSSARDPLICLIIALKASMMSISTVACDCLSIFHWIHHLINLLEKTLIVVTVRSL